MSDRAVKVFAADVRAKNRFFAAVGSLPALTRAGADRLVAIGETKALDEIRSAANKGKW